MIKKELRKKLEAMFESQGGAEAASEEIEELAKKVEEEFDSRVSKGQGELDAYRELLTNVDKIKKIFDGIRESEKSGERAEKRERERRSKNAKAILDSIEACMWILTVVLYFAISFAFGHWHLTWLIFLYASIGSVIFDMVRKCTKGISLEEVLHEDFSGVLWLGCVILYFLYSFTVGGFAWAYSWLIFPLCAVVEVIRSGIWRSRH